MATKQEATAASATAVRNSDATSGWDPYEVWRTRVLLPRLADAKSQRLPLPAPAALRVAVRRIASSDETSQGGPLDGRLERNLDDDSALRRELIDVIGALCLAGLTSILLNDSRQARRTRLAPLTRL